MADGTPAAVKVQYPGAGNALMADVAMLNGLTPLLRAAVPGMDAKRLFAELGDRLADEVDYVLEADAQAAFADAYRHDPDIHVPDVLVVEDRVLITTWVDGTPLADILRSGTTEQRDRAGLLLVQFLLASPARAGRLHADPHPGNFPLLPDGRLAEGAGLLRQGKVKPDALLALLDPYFEPLRRPTHTFSRPWMQEQTLRASDPRSAAARTQRGLSVPARHLLVQRVAAGLLGVLCSLGATVPMHDEAERWLPGYR